MTRDEFKEEGKREEGEEGWRGNDEEVGEGVRELDVERMDDVGRKGEEIGEEFAEGERDGIREKEERGE